MPQPKKNSGKNTPPPVEETPTVVEEVLEVTAEETPVVESPQAVEPQIPELPAPEPITPTVTYKNSTGRSAEVHVGGTNHRIPANESITVATHLENELLTATRHTGRWVKQK